MALAALFVANGDQAQRKFGLSGAPARGSLGVLEVHPCVQHLALKFGQQIAQPTPDDMDGAPGPGAMGTEEYRVEVALRTREEVPAVAMEAIL